MTTKKIQMCNDAITLYSGECVIYIYIYSLAAWWLSPIGTCWPHPSINNGVCQCVPYNSESLINNTLKANVIF